MDWVKLIDCKGKSFFRGTVFRLPGKHPYEEWVDFIAYDPFIDNKGLALMVSSGYKGGLPLVVLPNESKIPGEHSIAREWLVKNWSYWIYPDCDVSEIYISKGYTATPLILTNTG